MPATVSRLQEVGTEEIPELLSAEPPKEHAANKIAGDTILLALSALSQRTIVALGQLFTLLTVASAFVLWFVTPEPTVYQLVKLGLYALFVLGANWIVRRR